MSEVDAVEALDRRTRLSLFVQRVLGGFCASVLISLLTLVLRWGLGYRIRDLRQLRERYRALSRQGERPLLICSNHLTLIDSALLIWALGSPWFYATRFTRLPWNLPERRNFGGVVGVLLYLVKCIPIERGGKRADVAHVLRSVEHLLASGEPVMIFPEAGRSRTGRVSTETPAHGVGRLLNALPDCRVLCVYMRGDRQQTWSDFPARSDTFTVELSLLEPVSQHRGMRRSHDLAQQVVVHIAQMEHEHFAQQRKSSPSQSPAPPTSRRVEA